MISNKDKTLLQLLEKDFSRYYLSKKFSKIQNANEEEFASIKNLDLYRQKLAENEFKNYKDNDKKIIADIVSIITVPMTFILFPLLILFLLYDTGNKETFFPLLGLTIVSFIGICFYFKDRLLEFFLTSSIITILLYLIELIIDTIDKSLKTSSLLENQSLIATYCLLFTAISITYYFSTKNYWYKTRLIKANNVFKLHKKRIEKIINTQD